MGIGFKEFFGEEIVVLGVVLVEFVSEVGV